MATVAENIPQLLGLIEGTARLEGGRLRITDEAAFRARTVHDLAWTQTFSTDAATVEAARWLILEASQELGSPSASIHELYAARSRGEVSGFTVPAINLRAQTFDMARTIFATAKAKEVGPVILELARSEQTYTYQRVFEYAPTSSRARSPPGGGTRLHPGRPLPVQRQEVRGRRGGGDRGDPEGLAGRDRRRLSQHRRGQLHARRPLAAQTSTPSRRSTTRAQPRSPR